MYQDEIPALVLDNGSCFSRAGFAGDEAPRFIIPSLLGTRKKTLSKQPLNPPTDIYIGDEASSQKQLLDLHRPIQRGHITNWDHMEQFWHYQFHHVLKTSPEHPAVLLSDCITSTAATTGKNTERERTSQVMFEKFSVQSLCIASSACLSMFGGGRGSGVVLECGYEVSHAVPMFEGVIAKPLPTSSSTTTIRTLEIGGLHLDQYLLKLLRLKLEETNMLHSSSMQLLPELVMSMKEELARVTYLQGGESSLKSEKKPIFELPDGNTIEIEKERYECVEPLFNPKLLGGEYCDNTSEVGGIQDMLFNSITSTNYEERYYYYRHILLSGGTTLLPGFAERIKEEIRESAPSAFSIHVSAYPERKLLSWIGGSVLASMSVFNDKSVSKSEFEEEGPRVTQRKFTN
ncbi:hypothetical protein C9374_001431 [Naegleria lovaniensis]|uniref:Actin n=1 Tax=Naegleria lovaniensis TaxID=51637 RepID=A0AA88KS83_NAELO|nr:uncharacterized protein C9374_001431 [Naegleria lovaniensis]KAG2387837.1 hypothetical protein C9374_001431 [Naegleria lovaniensis]